LLYKIQFNLTSGLPSATTRSL